MSSHAEYGGTPTNSNPYHNSNSNVAWFEKPPKSNGFFRGPCVTFPPNFVKIG